MSQNNALQRRIEDLERQAAKSDAAASRAKDDEEQLYNTSLARKLRAIASRLRADICAE